MQVANPKAEFYIQDYLQAHGKSLQNMKPGGVPYFNLIDHILTQWPAKERGIKIPGGDRK